MVCIFMNACTHFAPVLWSNSAEEQISRDRQCNSSVTSLASIKHLGNFRFTIFYSCHDQLSTAIWLINLSHCLSLKPNRLGNIYIKSKLNYFVHSFDKTGSLPNQLNFLYPDIQSDVSNHCKTLPIHLSMTGRPDNHDKNINNVEREI